MTDPYRLSGSSDPHSERHQAPGQVLRSVLWLILLVSLAANATAALLGVTPLVGAGFGAVALGSIAALIVHHYRTRRG